MKIGIVSPYYMHTFGGVQTLILELQRLLIARGHEVIIVAPKPAQEEVATPDGVALLGLSRQINFKNPFHTTFPLAASNRAVVADFLQRQNFDVLNIHEPWMPLLPYQILQEAFCPIVGTTHARWPQSLFNKSLEKMRVPYFKAVLGRLNQITAVSSVAAKNVTLVDENFPVQIIPNAIDCATYQADIKQARQATIEPYMFYLNRLERRKGPRFLLKAYRRYMTQVTQPLPLIIAGNGPQKDNLQAYVARHNLQKLVRFEGYVSTERKLELFANAQLYVSPALYGESFGIVLLEAMAANVPIVAGNNEGYQTVLQDIGAESLIDPHRQQEFADTLARFGHDDKARANWQAWASQAITQYDYPLIVDQYEKCFHNALAN